MNSLVYAQNSNAVCGRSITCNANSSSSSRNRRALLLASLLASTITTRPTIAAPSGLAGYTYNSRQDRRSELEKLFEFDTPSKWDGSTETLEELKSTRRNRSPPSNVRRGDGRESKLSIPEQVAEVERLTAEARSAEGRNDYGEALACYEEIISSFPELAITEYARISRGLNLFQLGRKSDAILQMDELTVTLRGKSEVHAALAVMEYDAAKTRGSILAAAYIVSSEKEWAKAQEWNNKWSVEYAKKNTRWPPRMLNALSAFLELK